MRTVGDWNEPEIKRFMNRQVKLMEIGMTEKDAEIMAENLLYRDRPNSGDDRRVCLECALWKGRCTAKAKAAYCTVPTVLQRCEGFALRGAAVEAVI